MTSKKSAKTEAASAETVTAARLREVLHYDAETGLFRWLIDRGPARMGNAAGSKTQHGYIVISIDCRRYYAHRLAWLYSTGEFPAEQLDHINGDGSDNSITNLRECSNSENCQNLGRRKNNSSGLTGVYWSRDRKKWSAQIRDGGKITPLGRYESKQEAHAAYLAAKKRAHTFQPTPRQA